MEVTGTVQQTDVQAGFDIYHALKHVGGKSCKGIHQVLMNQGLDMPMNDLRRCLATASKAELMKKTKRGYRLEKRICDMLITSLFHEVQDKKISATDILSNGNSYICDLGPICHKHDVNEEKVGELRRGTSFLSVLGGRLVRTLSFLTPKKNEEETSLKRAVGEQNDEETTPPSKKPCIDEGGQQSLNHVLEKYWNDMTQFIRNIEETQLLRADVSSTEEANDTNPES